MTKRVQYARNYLELLDLFERNGIDVWLTENDVFRELEEKGIESPDNVERMVYPRKLIHALRHADATGEDRMQVTIALEAARRDDVGEAKLPVDRLATEGFVTLGPNEGRMPLPKLPPIGGTVGQGKSDLWHVAPGLTENDVMSVLKAIHDKP